MRVVRRRPPGLRLRRHPRRGRHRRGARRGPRQRRVRHPRRVPRAGRARRRRRCPSSTSSARRWPTFPTGKKVDLALELERAVQAADPRITGVESAEFVDAMGEGCVVTTTGIRTSSRSTACYVATYCLATEGDETQTGFGFSVGREPADLDLSVAAADAARRATRLLGATKPAERPGHRRARPVRHRAAARHPRRHAVGRGRAEGPLAVRRPAGRGGRRRRCSPWSTTPPTRSPTPRRPPTARAWPPGATR